MTAQLAYCQLAGVRYTIQEFVDFSEQAARENGLDPQQHQLLLSAMGLSSGTRPTITLLAERLCLRHHSTDELVKQMVERE